MKWWVALSSAIALQGCSLLISEDLASEDALPPAADAGPLDDSSRAGDTSIAPADAGNGEDVGVDAGLDPSLLAFWTFDNGAAQVQKDETQRYDFVVSSGASIDPALGVRGGAVVFTGSSTPRIDALSGANFPRKGTLSFWFKYTFADSDTTNKGVFDDWDNQRNHVFVRRIGADTPGHFQTALQPTITSNSYAWAQSFDTQKDKWTHVVMTWDPDARMGALYVNGVIVKSSSYQSGEEFAPAEQDFRVGDGFVGAFDEIRLYSRVLSEAEAVLLP